ncbi:hypothetical protein MUP37_07030 [Candidatus Bathyarchaeota archaeon]|nr:hypothetical protein [Candidatus Bathyarchaeota archaeon]
MAHRREWRCPNCGSLRHGSRPERCPECGWIFRDTPLGIPAYSLGYRMRLAFRSKMQRRIRKRKYSLSA